MQVAASTNKEVDTHIPNYPSLPPQLICQLHNVTMHVSFCPYCIRFCVLWPTASSSLTCQIQADVETDEVYAQMTLQPLTQVVKFNFVPLVFFSSYPWVSCSWIIYIFSYVEFCSKSKRMPTSLPNWVTSASSQPIIFLRHSLQVILVLMGDSLFLVELLKKCFLHW